MHGSRHSRKILVTCPSNRRPFIYSRTLCPRAILDQEVTTPRAKDAKFPVDKEQLNLKPNVEGVLECRGRIQSDYPEYLPLR